MITALYILLILTCIVLIVSVLLQPGKADAGALFSSAISSAAFGPRGTQTLLAKLTIGAAALFMLTAIAISLSSGERQQSKMRSEAGEQQQTTPAQPSTPAAPGTEGVANPNATGNTGAPVESQAPPAPAATGAETGGAAQPSPTQ